MRGKTNKNITSKAGSGVKGVDRMLGKIDAAILAKYAVIKQQGSILAGIDNLYRQLRFCNPELALYVKQKMLQIAKEQGDLP